MTGTNEEEVSGSSSAGSATPLEVEVVETKKKKRGGPKGHDDGPSVPFFKLFSFADSTDKFLMIIGSIGAIGNGLCLPLMTIIFGDLINAFGQNQNDKKVVVHTVSMVALKFVYLAIGVAVAASLQVMGWMVTGERQSARIRNLYLNAILRQDVAYFDTETTTGEVVGRMSGDTVIIQNAMGEKVGQCIQLIATLFGGFAIAFAQGWLLTVVMLCCIPLLASAGASMAVIVSKMSTRGQNAYAQASIVVEQSIGSIRTLHKVGVVDSFEFLVSISRVGGLISHNLLVFRDRGMVASFTGEKHALERYNKSIVSAYKASIIEGAATGMGLGVLMFVVFGTYAMAVWFGSKMVIERGYSGGGVLNVIIAVLIGSMSLGQIGPCMAAFGAGKAAAFKMFETINRKPVIDASSLEGRVLDDINGDIELKDVHFSYPARPDEPIFRGFSLSISSGTTVALVGQSGSGKSTVVSLIERFYDPQAGEVLIDGINLKDFQLKWIRHKIGLVSQEPVLFAASIRENIAYGKDGATDEEIRTATELANAAKFIDKLPQGLDTSAGEHGTQLSGGQKQRIAIARAILKNPRILLLDEATSALDAESERVVQEALDRIMVNRTTIVVAHRLSTIRNADMICVIHQGKVVEQGTHSKLLVDPEGAYSQLIRLQESRKEPEPTETSRSFSLNKAPSLRSLSKASSGRSSRGSRRALSLIFGVGADAAESMMGGDSDAESDDESKQHPEVPLGRLAALNKPEIPVLFLGALFAIANGCVFPIFGILISRAIKIFFEPPHLLREDSKFWAGMFAVLGAGALLATPGRTYFFAVAGAKLIQRIRSMCFEKVLNMEIGWFDDPQNSSGAIGARLSADAAAVKGLVGDALGLIVQNIATAAAGLVIAFIADWILALVILVLLPLVGLNGYVQMKFMKGFSADAKKKYEGASQVANDAVGSIRTVASFCAEEKVINLYESKCQGPVKAGIRLGLISGLGFGISNALMFLVYALSFYVGAQLVGHGKTTFGDVFQVFFALTMAAVGISQSSSMSPDSSKAKTAAGSIFAILDRESKIDSSDESGTPLDEVKGEIELKHVGFKYPTRPDIQIFRDINLAIRAGKTVALVGESGSGKSTIVSLLQRFYDPDSGVITLDGNDLRSFPLKWLRLQMGLVSQEPILFNETIRANIAYGKEGEATEAEIIAAAELANAHTFISALQQGYDTIVGERGTQLSGGQKQRVAIARAIIKSPKILLLDEATSALDAESERVVQDALDRVMVNRTTIVVAHRLSTIKHADVIAVVKNGVIAEKGRHETLLRIKDGVYQSLVALHTSAS